MRTMLGRHKLPTGFTLVESAVVVAVIVVVAGILLSAVLRARERARRARCADNLKLIALACQQYESTHGSFPQGRNLQATVNHPGTVLIGYHSGWSLLAALMSDLGRPELFNSCNFNLAPYQFRNNTASATLMPLLWCPSDGEITNLRCLIEERRAWDGVSFRVTYSSYCGFMGSFGFGQRLMDPQQQMIAQDGMFPDVGLPTALGGAGTRPAVKARDVLGGLSNTLLLGERAHGKLSKFNCGPGGQCSFRGNGWWASSDFGDASISAFYPPNFTPNDILGTHALGDPGSPTARCDSATPFVMSVSSFHPGGANCAFVDGSVRFVKDTINSWNPRTATDSLDANCIPDRTGRRGVYQAIASRNGSERGDGQSY